MKTQAASFKLQQPNTSNSRRRWSIACICRQWDYVGKKHIVPGRVLRQSIKADQLLSLIRYDPPGTGKTTLTGIIANTSSCALTHRSCSVDFKE